MGMVQLPRLVNETTRMQAAVPTYEVQRLFSLMGVGLDAIRSIALIIMIVSGLSIFISLYNAMKTRQYDLALLRTYGATRWELVRMVLHLPIWNSCSACSVFLSSPPEPVSG